MSQCINCGSPTFPFMIGGLRREAFRQSHWYAKVGYACKECGYHGDADDFDICYRSESSAFREYSPKERVGSVAQKKMHKRWSKYRRRLQRLGSMPDSAFGMSRKPYEFLKKKSTESLARAMQKIKQEKS